MDEPIPGQATNLDRRGAVVALRSDSRLDAVLEAASAVEVRVGLPPHAGRSPRSLHCLGEVISRSMDNCHRYWIVLRFSQIFVRSAEDEVLAVNHVPTVANGGGVRGPTASEG